MDFTTSVKYQNNPILRETFEFAVLIVQYSADETEYWLFLCKSLENYQNPDHLILKLSGILKILNKIVSTTKRN